MSFVMYGKKDFRLLFSVFDYSIYFPFNVILDFNFANTRGVLNWKLFR